MPSTYQNRSYWAKLKFSKLWFSESKKIVSRSVFGVWRARTHADVTEFAATFESEGWEQKRMWLFY